MPVLCLSSENKSHVGFNVEILMGVVYSNHVNHPETLNKLAVYIFIHRVRLHKFLSCIKHLTESDDCKRIKAAVNFILGKIIAVSGANSNLAPDKLFYCQYSNKRKHAM